MYQVEQQILDIHIQYNKGFKKLYQALDLPCNDNTKE